MSKAWTYLGHKCRKCGNDHISYDDPFNYGRLDAELIPDVPDNLTHKHEKPGGKWYPEILELPFALLLVSLMPLFTLIAILVEGFNELRQHVRR